MSLMKRLAPIIMAILVMSLSLTAAAAPLTKSSQKELELAGVKAIGNLKVQVSASEISVAESLTLTIEVNEPAGTKARLPVFSELGFATDFSERSRRFRLTDVSEISREPQAAGNTIIHQTYTLEPWLSGDYAILPIMVPFYEVIDAGHDIPKVPLFSLMTDGIRVKVTPLTEDRHELSPIFGQADLNKSGLLNKERRLENKSDQELEREKEAKKEARKALEKKEFPWLIIWLMLALIIILPGLWYLNRKKVKTFFQKKITPPHITADLAFTALQKKGLLQDGLVKEFYYELSFILREYIGGRFKIFAQHQTTEEFFQELLQNNPFDSMAEQILRDFSEKSDTVKYSLFRPDPTQAEESLEIARSFVDHTAEKEPS